MTDTIQLGDVVIDVVRKRIKNVYLRVYPPSGQVRVSVPARLSMAAVRAFVVARLGWIKTQQGRLQLQRLCAPKYLDGEAHYVWGKPYLLTVVENTRTPSIVLNDDRLTLTVRPQSDEETKRAILERWYRRELKLAIATLIAKWAPLMDVSVSRFYVQRMRTRWGSCNPRRQSIRLNTDLASKPREYLEYVVVHEMVHLLEASHNARFLAFMDRFMPDWRDRKKRLNKLAIM